MTDLPLVFGGVGQPAARIRHRRQDTAHATSVDVQPRRLVPLRRHWHLVACPRGADGWMVYALDRIEHVQSLGTHLPSLQPPADTAAFVSSALAHGAWRHRVRVQVHTSDDLVRELVDPSVATVIDDGDECELRFGTDYLDWAARWLSYLSLDIDVIEPTCLTDELRTLLRPGICRWLPDRYGARRACRRPPPS